jgi:PAS domain S-box-containing protein
MKTNKSLAQTYLDTAETILVSLDNSGNVLMLNRYGLEFFGYEEKQIVGKNWFDIVLPDAEDKEKVFPVFKSIIEGNLEPVKSFENDVVTSKGERRTVVWRNGYMLDDEGKITGTLSSGLDITDYKKRTKDLQINEEKYRTLFENLSHGIFYQAADGKIIDANNAALKMFGVTRNQFLGNDSFDPRWKVIDENFNVIPPEKHPSMKALLSGKSVLSDVVGIFIPETGLYNWIIIDVIPQFHPGEDKPYQVFASMQDITELKQNQIIDECRLRLLLFAETHSLYELFEETLNEVEKITESKTGFYNFVDEDQSTIRLQNWSTRTKAEYCNAEGFAAEYPISKAGIWADCIREKKPIIHNDYSSAKNRKGLPEGHAEVIRELVVPVIRSGKVTAALGIGNKPFFYTSQDINIVSKIADLAWDIAKQKLASDALQKSEAKLKDLNAQKDKFFSIIAHDLRSPFNSILGMSEILADQIKEKDYEGIEEYARMIFKSSERAMDLLMNLLEWARSQTGRMEFNPELFDLAGLIIENIKLFSDGAANKSITIIKQYPEELSIYADKDMLGTVLRNLISNAVKFTYPGGKITIAAKKDKKEVVVSISDKGVGIDPALIDNIFEVSHSFTTPGTNNENGTGLGLVLCKELIDKNKGKIWVESVKGRGTVFYFSIPGKE